MKCIIWLPILFLCVIEQIDSFCGSGGCIFEGESYKPGVPVEFGNFVFQCTDENTWQFLYIIAGFPICSACNDPHFYTFDSHYYDFHGLCNYTISQPLLECDEISSYYPPYGIFGDFRECVAGWSGPPRCLDLTTYKISDTLSVQIEHNSSPPSLEINGHIVGVTSSPISYYDCSYSSSVIIWVVDNCIFIVGPQYAIIACYGCITLYVFIEDINSVGLCGSLPGTTGDKSLLRDCTEISLDPSNWNSFGENWKTIDQRDEICLKKDVEDIKIKDCDDKDKEEAESICSSYVEKASTGCPAGYSEEKAIIVLENCIKDCCSTGIENCEKWANVAFEYLCTLDLLSNLTKGKGRE